MPIICQRKAEGDQYVPGKSADILYYVRGTDYASAAAAALMIFAPATEQNLPRESVSVEAVSVISGQPDRCVWTGTVRYSAGGAGPPPATGSSAYTFSTGGGTMKTTVPKGIIKSYAPSGLTAPTAHGIGDNGNECEGVDIIVPVYNWSETHYKSDSEVSDTYKAQLYALTGTTNQQDFRGFEAGEVLFGGASGSKRSDADWEITFNFSASPNVENWPIPGTGITIGEKKGWEYLWVRYAPAADNTAKAMYQKAIAAYVAQVYFVGNYSYIGIGT